MRYGWWTFPRKLSWEKIMCMAVPQVSDNPFFPEEAQTVTTRAGNMSDSG